jgi:membrane-associated protein
MEYINWFVDIILHLDEHLLELTQAYGVWVYAILFLIIYCETGLVVTPFLPGDSLLFTVGSLAAIGALDLVTVLALLLSASIAGDTTNYWVGRFIGPKVFAKQNSRIFRKEYLDRTHHFYEKYGGKTIMIAKFVPIVRTFAPFVAGVGAMTYRKFFSYNIAGGLVWVCGLIMTGYLFGNLPFVKEHFSLVIAAIIVISLLPGIIEFLRHRRQPA